MKNAAAVLRTAQAALLGLGIVVYIAAKVDFFRRYGTANYVREHSRYWAALLALGLLAGLLEILKKRSPQKQAVSTERR